MANDAAAWRILERFLWRADNLDKFGLPLKVCILRLFIALGLLLKKFVEFSSLLKSVSFFLWFGRLPPTKMFEWIRKILAAATMETTRKIAAMADEAEAPAAAAAAEAAAQERRKNLNVAVCVAWPLQWRKLSRVCTRSSASPVQNHFEEHRGAVQIVVFFWRGTLKHEVVGVFKYMMHYSK